MNQDVKRLIHLSSVRVRQVSSRNTLTSVVNSQINEVSQIKRSISATLARRGSTPDPPRSMTATPQRSLLHTAQDMLYSPSPRVYTPNLSRNPRSKSSKHSSTPMHTTHPSSSTVTQILSTVDRLQGRKLSKQRKLAQRHLKNRRHSCVSSSPIHSVSSPPATPSSMHNASTPISTGSLHRLTKRSRLPVYVGSVLRKAGVLPELATSAGLSSAALTLGASAIHVDNTKDFVERHRRRNKSQDVCCEIVLDNNLPFLEVLFGRFKNDNFFKDKTLALSDIDHNSLTYQEAVTLARFRTAILEEQRHLADVRSVASNQLSRLMGHVSRRFDGSLAFSEHLNNQSDLIENDPIIFDVDGDLYSDVTHAASSSSTIRSTSPSIKDSCSDKVDGIDTNSSDSSPIMAGSLSKSSRLIESDSHSDVSEPQFLTEIPTETAESFTTESTKDENKPEPSLQVSGPVLSPPPRDILDWLSTKYSEKESKPPAISLLEKSKYLNHENDLLTRAKESISRDITNWNRLVLSNQRKGVPKLPKKSLNSLSLEERKYAKKKVKPFSVL
ncbi:hypothetical protein P9112_011451 [Eukaryota sp. TZLM1-RC]